MIILTILFTIMCVLFAIMCSLIGIGFASMLGDIIVAGIVIALIIKNLKKKP